MQLSLTALGIQNRRANVNDHFADWYSLVSPQFDAKRLEDRWAAAVAYADSLEVAHAPDAVRLLLNFSNTHEQRDAIRKHARTRDSTYILTDDSLEVRVICAGAIANALTKRSYTADAIALSLLCGLFQKDQVESFVAEVSSASKRYLVSEGGFLRSDQCEIREISTNGVLDTVKAQAVVGDFASAHSNLLSAITAVMKAVDDHFESANNTISQIRKVQQEESDILWWLMGAQSLKTNLPYSKIKQPELALIAAYDLASITRQMPGPIASEAYLDHVIRLGRSKKDGITLKDAVNGMQLGTMVDLAPPADLGGVAWDLIPCYAAIAKAIEVGGKTGWEAAFSTVTGLDAVTSVKPTALAFQAYLERILVRVVKS
jgi:hypothetical protein